MPIFEFRCAACSHIFEKICVNSTDQVDLVCPECGATTLERVVSQTNYVMGAGPGGKQPTLTTKSCGSGNSCTTLELPGPSK